MLSLSVRFRIESGIGCVPCGVTMNAPFGPTTSTTWPIGRFISSRILSGRANVIPTFICIEPCGVSIAASTVS